MCIAGAIFSCLSIVLSTFSPNVGVLMLTYGIMGGFGVGCIYLPAVVACGYYFEKRRALATGLFSVFSLQCASFKFPFFVCHLSFLVFLFFQF